MSDPEELIERWFQRLLTYASPGYGRYMRPVMTGSAHLVLAAAIREAYVAGQANGLAMANGPKYLVVTQEQLDRIEREVKPRV